jgi:hypothetical protein
MRGKGAKAMNHLIGCLACAAFAPTLLAQSMPYSLAYVYTAGAETGDGMVSATTVATTGGSWGHTVAAGVRLQRPGGYETSATNSDFQYTSQATTYIEMCSGDTCYDGQYTATSVGTSEYCTPTSTEFDPTPPAQGYIQVDPFVRNQSVSFTPTSIGRTNASSTFRITVTKSPSCTSTTATLFVSHSIRKGNPQYSVFPVTTEVVATFGGTQAFADWTFTSSQFNESYGEIVSTGAITGNSAACRLDGQAGKEETLTIQ